MAEQEPELITGIHGHPSPSRSDGLFSITELIRPGIVAIRVQAFNDRSNGELLQPKSATAPSEAGGLHRLVRLSTRHDGLSVPKSKPAANSRSLPSELVDSGGQSRFGTRRGGGWATPAGRRISGRWPEVPSSRLYATDITPNLARRNHGVILRPTGRVGGQSAAPLDVITPKLGYRAVSSGIIERMGSLKDAQRQRKVDRHSSDTIKGNVPLLKSRHTSIQLSGTSDSIDHSLPVLNLDSPFQFSEESFNHSVSAEAQFESMSFAKPPHRLGSLLIPTQPIADVGDDGQVKHAFDLAKLEADQMRAYPHGGLQSRSASMCSKASLSRRSPSQSEALSICLSCEECQAMLVDYCDGPFVMSPENYSGDAQTEASPSQSCLTHRIRPGQASANDYRNAEYGKELDGQRRTSRPRSVKLPKHSVSAASLRALLERHESQERAKAWTSSHSVTKKPSDNSFKLLSLLPSLFAWKEPQGSGQPEENGVDSEKDISVAGGRKEPEYSVTKAVGAAENTIAHVEAGALTSPARAPDLDSGNAACEHCSLDHSGSGHYMRSSGARFDADATEIASLDATSSVLEKFSEAQESNASRSTVRRPRDNHVKAAPRIREQVTQPPEQPPEQQQQHQRDNPLVNPRTPAVLGSSNGAANDGNDHKGAKVGRICVVVSIEDLVEIAVTVEVRPLEEGSYSPADDSGHIAQRIDS